MFAVSKEGCAAVHIPVSQLLLILFCLYINLSLFSPLAERDKSAQIAEQLVAYKTLINIQGYKGSLTFSMCGSCEDSSELLSSQECHHFPVLGALDTSI